MNQKPEGEQSGFNRSQPCWVSGVGLISNNRECWIIPPRGGAGVAGDWQLSWLASQGRIPGPTRPLWSPDPLAPDLFFVSPNLGSHLLPTDQPGYFPSLGTSLLASVLEPQPNGQVLLLIPGDFHLWIRGFPEQREVLSSWKHHSSFSFIRVKWEGEGSK